MAYSLSHSYFGANFVSDFNWINYADPSNGFVRYQSQPDALAKGLYSIDPVTQAVTLGVDDTNVYALNEGRPSVRLESKQVYNGGLFIGDFAHMPPSVCGLWPAFWMYGPDWPASGEIDIIEGANQATVNVVSGHTTSGCTLPDNPAVSGQTLLTDCTSPGTTNNAGCNYAPPISDTHTYGDPFNAVGGGVYALEWTDDAISVWHWPRQSIPADILSKKPDPSGWGLPTALFGTSTCEVDKYFKDMSIVIQTNFCGDYAGNIWGQASDTCNQVAPTCNEYVANNPTAFTSAYWEVNYIDVYQLGLGNTTTSIPEPTTTTTVKTTTVKTTSTVFTTVPNPATMSHNSTALISTTRPSAAVSTAPPSPSTDPLVPEREPAAIDGYAFLGCFGSATGFSTFTAKASATDMTLQKCVDLCTPSKYAGVHQNECFCADELDPSTRAEAERERCNIPCPGNSTQFCGGNANVSPAPSRLMYLHRRAAPANYLLTVYGRVSDQTPPPAPPLGDPEPHVPSTSTVVTTVTYTTVVDGSMAPTEHVTTILVPGCNKYCAGDGQPNVIIVPMTTTVVSCNACGAHGENQATITIPLQIAAAPVTAAATGYYPTASPVTTTPPAGGAGGAPGSGVAPGSGGAPGSGSTPQPSMVPINSAPGRRLGWSACVGFAIGAICSVLVFVS